MALEPPFPMEIKGGLELCYSFIALRCGLGLDPDFVGAGIGLSLGWLRLDYAFLYHLLLPSTHSLTLCIARGFKR
jgi:hypothetical protein